MAYLLRVELPDVPGSLGALATVLGEAGADIEAIEIVEHRSDGRAVDDVLLELSALAMPDELITACQTLPDVEVHWISRYNAGANLSMDLEAIESFTEDPDHAIARLMNLLPQTFRTDWAMAVRLVDGDIQVIEASPSAPDLVADAATWLSVSQATTLPEVGEWEETLLAASPGKDRSGRSFTVVVGRYGGPAFLSSEIARLGHITALAASVQSV